MRTTFDKVQEKIPRPQSLEWPTKLVEPPPRAEDAAVLDHSDPIDSHPISRLMADADRRWREYEDNRSLTFKETVSKYRRKYGRHPPPGFKEWYLRARALNVHNVDDFEQIMDDLRPFWGVEPSVLRTLTAHAWEKDDYGISGLNIRNHQIVNITKTSWRVENMKSMIEPIVQYLPDMDIAMNRMDQPRVVVPWEDMQAHLAKEIATRQMVPEPVDSFTAYQTNLLNVTATPDEDPSPREDPGWYPAVGKQYMEIASTACPPGSHAREKEGGADVLVAESLYKEQQGGIVTNFNRSTDLCTVGPEIQDKHGLLFSASSMTATKRLVPVFGECKVNVNSDILFPANMYWLHDPRYDYSDEHDKDWDDKKDNVIWRGVTSGGTAVKETWRQLHRQRFVMYVNSTEMAGKEVRILSEKPEGRGQYENYRFFKPSDFAEKYTDVGFTEAWGCIPECKEVYGNDTWTFKEQIPISEQFKSKFLVDIDGHSFSGRWRAFLESKSMGIKATIFREWHDSRLFAWRHFVPMDNRYDDFYTLMTYFIGVGKAGVKGQPYVARHDVEARRIADQSREWAAKVLRRKDIEVGSSPLMT